MDEEEIINRIRGLGFMAGVLERQSQEPLCSSCISYAITLEESLDAASELKGAVFPDTLPAEFGSLFLGAFETITSLTIPAEPEKQRKSGRCHFPDKACFVKRARKVFLFFKEKISRSR